MENVSLTTWDPRYQLGIWLYWYCISASKIRRGTKNTTEIRQWLIAMRWHTLILGMPLECGTLSTRMFPNHDLWPSSSRWLKESWASYMQYCWILHSKGIDEFHYQLYLAAEDYFAECNKYMRPIVCRQYENSWHLFDDHLYPGEDSILLLNHPKGVPGVCTC